MATELLHCCICPKRPNFSDTSHLLTHVGSKGHLSHLHKLQVKSHQEPGATQQLAIYNQWFAEHNVAQLLSERMQMKESKQSKRKTGNEHRPAVAAHDTQYNVDPELLPILTLSSTIIDQSWPYEFTSSNGLPIQSPEATEDTSFEAARLKGMIWPGMDMFDSADEITQRKRNQKKDCSVLKKMQAMSQLVEPLETVCSPSGTVKKRRHMDDLEDDSPVEGESPPFKPSVKRRKPRLRNINSNALLSNTRKSRGTPYTPTKIKHNLPRSFKNNGGCGLQLDSNHAAIRSFGYNARDRGRKNTFTIFEDESPEKVFDLPDMVFPNPFRTGSPAQARPKPPAQISSAWQRMPLRLDHDYDPFRDYRSMKLASGAYLTSTDDKENANPLFWGKSFGNKIKSPVPATFDDFDRFEDNLGGLGKVYAFTRNPLFGSVTDHDADIKMTPNNSMDRRQQTDQNPVMFR